MELKEYFIVILDTKAKVIDSMIGLPITSIDRLIPA